MSEDEINLDLLKLVGLSKEKLLINDPEVNKLEKNKRKTIKLLTEWHNQLESEIFELKELKPSEEIEKSRVYKIALKKSIEERINKLNQ
jgi:hypothetical protein